MDDTDANCCKVDETGEDVRVKVLHFNHILLALLHLIREHGQKVGTAGCQNRPVGVKPVYKERIAPKMSFYLKIPLARASSLAQN